MVRKPRIEFEVAFYYEGLLFSTIPTSRLLNPKPASKLLTPGIITV
jgi:hypothetical protein